MSHTIQHIHAMMFEAMLHGRSVVLVEMQEGTIVVSKPFRGIDPALPGADKTVFLEIGHRCGKTAIFTDLMMDSIKKLEQDVPIFKVTSLIERQPDGWYRKFEKRQRGPKNV